MNLMRKYLVFFTLIFLGLLVYSQQLDDLLQKNNGIVNDNYINLLSEIYNCNYNLHNDSITVNGIKSKALLMSNVEWVPKFDIPNNSGHFSKGKPVTGLPYSSVKELQKFIGLDVSIYTFLTAVNNPYSLLYSEDVAEGNPCYLGGTYNGKNSHTFYGTVCSSFTAFCYGENDNYTSDNYRNNQVPNYYLKADQSIENVSSGDLFWCPGHVALLTEVEKDSLGKISKIELFESAGTGVHSKIYTPISFLLRMSGNGNPQKQAYIYRNKLVEQSNSNLDNNPLQNNIQWMINNLPVKNQEICTWFGDKPCIGEWDRIMINFNKKDYDRIIISLNDEVIDTLDISNVEHSIEYKNIGRGIYKAQLASDTIISSDYTSFEIINTATKLHQNPDGTLEVLFADGSQPEIVYWINKAGEQHTFPITISSEAKKEGKMTIQPCNKKDAMLRVIYRGKYGRATNRPDHLF